VQADRVRLGRDDGDARERQTGGHSDGERLGCSLAVVLSQHDEDLFPRVPLTLDACVSDVHRTCQDS
jgi:hypothetical protein